MPDKYQREVIAKMQEQITALAVESVNTVFQSEGVTAYENFDWESVKTEIVNIIDDTTHFEDQAELVAASTAYDREEAFEAAKERGMIESAEYYSDIDSAVFFCLVQGMVSYIIEHVVDETAPYFE